MVRAMRFAVGAGLAALTTTVGADAKNYNYECVTQYAACGNGNINNSCLNAEGFDNVMSTSGHHNIGSYEESRVWDTDSLESDRVVGGQDNLYTDVVGNGAVYFSMHGSCGNYFHNGAPCGTDVQCTNYYYPTIPYNRCDTWSRTCSGYDPHNLYNSSRFNITCSSADRYGHGSSITTQMSFGEYPGITWGGVGQNGGVDFVFFDVSCPFAAPPAAPGPPRRRAGRSFPGAGSPPAAVAAASSPAASTAARAW